MQNLTTRPMASHNIQIRKDTLDETINQPLALGASVKAAAAPELRQLPFPRAQRGCTAIWRSTSTSDPRALEAVAHRRLAESGDQSEAGTEALLCRCVTPLPTSACRPLRRRRERLAPRKHCLAAESHRRLRCLSRQIHEHLDLRARDAARRVRQQELARAVGGGSRREAHQEGQGGDGRGRCLLTPAGIEEHPSVGR
eukprot:scaffold6706_cov119-Isochrysis_galbana.AAC.4